MVQILGMPEDKKAAYRAVKQPVQEAFIRLGQGKASYLSIVFRNTIELLGIKLDPTDEVDKVFQNSMMIIW